MALLEIGWVIRPHGLRGEVVVELVTNRLERLRPGTELSFCLGPDGRPRPLVVQSSRPHSRRYLVRFVGVEGIDAAEALRGGVLSAPAVEEDGAFFVHELIGKSVIDGLGISRGRVTSVQDNPASDLLVLEDGHLVPVRFVVEVTDSTCRRGPGGLLRMTVRTEPDEAGAAPPVPLRVGVLSIFPEVIEAYCQESIIGRARRDGVLEMAVHDLREFRGR